MDISLVFPTAAMAKSLKYQTTIMAIMYAVKSNKDIFVKVIGEGDDNLQPFVYGCGESVKDILDLGYRYQSLLCSRSGLHTEQGVYLVKDSDTDWRALNVYYATMLDVKKYTLLDSSSNPIIRLDEKALCDLALSATGFKPLDLFKVFSALLAKGKTASGIGKNINAAVQVKIADYQNILRSTSERIKRVDNHELKSIKDSARTLEEMMFRKSTRERELIKEARVKMEGLLAVAYFKDLERKRLREEEEERKAQQKREEDEDQMLVNRYVRAYKARERRRKKKKQEEEEENPFLEFL